MKTITFVEIDNYQIISGIENTSSDPAETNAIVEDLIAHNPDILLKKTRDELLKENGVPNRVRQGQKNVDDTEGEKLKGILKKLETHEKLLLSGDTIVDLRGKEYWIKQTGVWNKQKIERMGETFPENAVLPDELSKMQQEEIAEQNEAERIANLTQEQIAEEKIAALTAAKREVRVLKEEAEIAGESFNASTEYQLRKAKIEERYG